MQQGVRTILWLTGALNTTSKDTRLQQHPFYDWVRDQGYALNQGTPSEWWKGKGVHLDFTNPAAVAWWNSQLDKVFKDGVSGWKVDQAEIYFGDTVITSKGPLTNEQFRPYYYNSMYEYTVNRLSGEGMIVGRPFSHQGGIEADVSELSLGWCGDFTGDWAGLKKQIATIYKSAELGYGALACEVGGFYKQRSNKVQLIRYCQFGAMTASMINGGENGAFTNHLPWYHDRQTETIYRYYVTLHEELIPYLFSIMVDGHLNGESMIRDFSFKDESPRLGPFLFTKAITASSGTLSYTLPEGVWYDFKTGKRVEGGKTLYLDAASYPLEDMPLFIKEGALIPMAIRNEVTRLGDASFSEAQTILTYPKAGASYTYHKPLGDGTAYEDIYLVWQEPHKLTVKGTSEDQYIFLVRGCEKPNTVSGADSWDYDLVHKTLVVRKRGRSFTISFS
jgi:alpha-glucosidase (family GH31 glycosyl hydrolase)